MSKKENKIKDMVCLADKYVCSTAFAETGLNDMYIVTGTTGTGKTTSYSEARMLHTYNTSIVVPLSKGRLKKEYGKLFKSRGYEVVDLDFNKPELCEVGYDPLDYVKSDNDILNLAKQIMSADQEDDTKKDDPYWDNAAANVIAAAIHLIILNAKDSGKKPSFAKAMELLQKVSVNDRGSNYETNIDFLFEKAESRHPGNMATKLWKTVQGNAPKTAGCIMSIALSAVNGMFSNSILEMVSKPDKLDLRDLGRKKMIVFITTSPFNMSLSQFVNIMYADMFRVLFELAESRPEGHLDVPVHVICDDFACGTKIAGFENYISIFRAAGIGASLLLQSESQLKSMYGEGACTTIINNCDTYLYMGGSDITTCTNISKRLNKPVSTVMNMPLEQVVVFRRGSEPVMTRRYQTYQDPTYVEAFGKSEVLDRIL